MSVHVLIQFEALIWFRNYRKLVQKKKLNGLIECPTSLNDGTTINDILSLYLLNTL